MFSKKMNEKKRRRSRPPNQGCCEIKGAAQNFSQALITSFFEPQPRNGVAIYQCYINRAPVDTRTSGWRCKIRQFSSSDDSANSSSGSKAVRTNWYLKPITPGEVINLVSPTSSKTGPLSSEDEVQLSDTDLLDSEFLSEPCCDFEIKAHTQSISWAEGSTESQEEITDEDSLFGTLESPEEVKCFTEAIIQESTSGEYGENLVLSEANYQEAVLVYDTPFLLSVVETDSGFRIIENKNFPLLNFINNYFKSKEIKFNAFSKEAYLEIAKDYVLVRQIIKSMTSKKNKDRYANGSNNFPGFVREPLVPKRTKKSPQPSTSTVPIGFEPFLQRSSILDKNMRSNSDGMQEYAQTQNKAMAPSTSHSRSRSFDQSARQEQAIAGGECSYSMGFRETNFVRGQPLKQERRFTAPAQTAVRDETIHYDYLPQRETPRKQITCEVAPLNYNRAQELPSSSATASTYQSIFNNSTSQNYGPLQYSQNYERVANYQDQHYCSAIYDLVSGVDNYGSAIPTTVPTPVPAPDPHSYLPELKPYAQMSAVHQQYFSDYNLMSSSQAMQHLTPQSSFVPNPNLGYNIRDNYPSTASYLQPPLPRYPPPPPPLYPISFTDNAQSMNFAAQAEAYNSLAAAQHSTALPFQQSNIATNQTASLYYPTFPCFSSNSEVTVTEIPNSGPPNSPVDLTTLPGRSNSAPGGSNVSFRKRKYDQISGPVDLPGENRLTVTYCGGGNGQNRRTRSYDINNLLNLPNPPANVQDIPLPSTSYNEQVSDMSNMTPQVPGETLGFFLNSEMKPLFIPKTESDSE